MSRFVLTVLSLWIASGLSTRSRLRGTSGSYRKFRDLASNSQLVAVWRPRRCGTRPLTSGSASSTAADRNGGPPRALAIFGNSPTGWRASSISRATPGEVCLLHTSLCYCRLRKRAASSSPPTTAAPNRLLARRHDVQPLLPRSVWLRPSNLMYRHSGDVKTPAYLLQQAWN